MKNDLVASVKNIVSKVAKYVKENTPEEIKDFVEEHKEVSVLAGVLLAFILLPVILGLLSTLIEWGVAFAIGYFGCQYFIKNIWEPTHEKQEEKQPDNLVDRDIEL